jgi:hypothetical protein
MSHNDKIANAFRVWRQAIGTELEQDALADLRRVVNDIHWQREAARWRAFDAQYGAGK